MLKKGTLSFAKSLFNTSLRNLTIKIKDTPNPSFLKFVLDQKVMKEGTMDYVSEKYAHNSPLAKSLFSISGVTRVFYGQDHISVGKKDEIDWNALESEIVKTIEDFYSKGEPLFTDEPRSSDTEVNENDSEVIQLIKEILDTRVRPLVQEDGGDIVYKSFNEQTGVTELNTDVVTLLMKGSCAGCPSSGATLKGGIERMLCHYIPEVTSVESEDFQGEAS